MTVEQINETLNLADTEGFNGNIDRAEQLANEVLSAVEKELTSSKSTADPIYKKELLRIRAKIGFTFTFIYRMRGNMDLSITNCKEALEIAEIENFNDLIARGSRQLGINYTNLSDFAQAMEFFNKSCDVYYSLEDEVGAANNLVSMGNIYLYQADYTGALDYYSRALPILEKHDDKSGIAIALGNIGNAYLCLANNQKALEYLFKALSMHEALQEKNSVARVNLNIGTAYVNECDYRKSLVFYSAALDIYVEVGDKNHAVIVRGNIGNVYARLEDYSKALEALNEAYNESIVLGNKRVSISFLLNIGNLYANEKFDGYDAEKAEKLIKEAIQSFMDLGSKREAYGGHKALAELFEKQNRWEESHTQFKLFYQLEKEVLSEEATRQAQMMEIRRKIQEAERDRQVKLAAFQEKEKILHHVLPAVIAERIVNGEKQIADYFPGVSILFADIEGFTPMSADMPAHMVVKFLNHIFSEFDRIMKKHGVEKIKTIGDGYMAIAGAPIACDDHAERLTNAAFEMMGAISVPEEIEPFLPENTRLAIRIGLHTGSVVAGVVGEDRFVYDVYSDAVNTASRMESHGKSGKVHVSADFMKHLMNRFLQTNNTTHGIHFESRGEIEIKGKGKMKTYFLNRSLN